MPGDSFCIQYTNCTGCPKNVENILVYRNLPKGEHIPKDKCTQNCMLFMIKGELLINSEEHPGITLRERQIVLQAIGSKVEILALTDVEYVVYWFNELPLLCEDRYKEMMEQAEAPLTYTPLIMSERLYHLVTSMPEFLAEENPCSKYIDLKCKELVFLITNFYPLPQLGSFFYPISTYTESFHYFVMQNYSNVKNVEEFAHLGGYTTTTFRRLFKNSLVCPYTNGYWKRNGKEFWKTCSTPKCESLKSVTDTDSTPCRISHTSVKTLSAIPHALYAKKQPAVRKSGKYNKQSHPTNVPISCTMRAYWLAY